MLITTNVSQAFIILVLPRSVASLSGSSVFLCSVFGSFFVKIFKTHKAIFRPWLIAFLGSFCASSS